uniref:Ripply transcriptional repressor 2 n=1 Tax=Lepisosteus oculatus TaxID=7918 RepID=W5NIJ6_LEPOC
LNILCFKSNSSANLSANSNVHNKITNLWRPWCLQSESRRKERRTNNFPYPSPMVNVPGMKHTETVHPAKLFWPRSKCYDYLYHEAEILLRNYPVQATISFYEDSSTDTDSDSDEEDETAYNVCTELCSHVTVSV